MRRAAPFVLLLACTRAPPPAPTAPTIPAAASAGPPPFADASLLDAARSADDAAAAAPVAVRPLPAPIAGADPERVRIAASICAASYMRSPGAKSVRVGCVFHPPFVATEQRPDGRLTEYTGDPRAFCAIDEVYRGAFTKAGVKEAVVVFSQCMRLNDDAWDMGFPGSGMLVEEAGDRWRVKAYRDGVDMDHCMRARKADGGDALVCKSSLWAGMSGELAYVFAIDFAQPSPATTLARLYSDIFECRYGDTLPDGFSRTHLKNVAVTDTNGDGVADVVLSVTRSRTGASPAIDARVKAACAAKTDAALPIAMPPDAPHKLVFVGTPTGYSADVATARTLAAWAIEDPAGYRGLDAVAP